MQSEKQWDHYTMAMTRRTETYHLHSYLGYIPRAVHWKSVGIIQPSTKDVQRTKDSNHLFLDDAVKHPLCLSASATFDHSIPRCRRVICYCIPPPPPMSASPGFWIILHAAFCMPYVVINEEWHSLSRQRYPYLLCSLNPWMKSSRNWFKLVYYMTFTKLLSTNFSMRSIRWLIVDTTIPDEDKASRCWKESSSGDCSE